MRRRSPGAVVGMVERSVGVVEFGGGLKVGRAMGIEIAAGDMVWKL